MNSFDKNIYRYRTILLIVIVFVVSIQFAWANSKEDNPKIILAYVEYFRKTTPDPNLMTHIIYAFATFNDANDAIVIPTPKKLTQLVNLKKVNPNLKIIIGVGGSKRDGFSEMAMDEDKMGSFANSCVHIIQKYGLDGIDLDWEFPTTTQGGHTASPDDDVNYIKVVKILRDKLGHDKWISVYSNNSGRWIKFREMLPYISYVNVSGYNLRVKGGHQSNLFSSEKCGDWSVSKSIQKHIDEGVPPYKILLGVPFFARGVTPCPKFLGNYQIDGNVGNLSIQWDSVAKAPFYGSAEEGILLSFENVESIMYKCEYVYNKSLAGIFYWAYDLDFSGHLLAKAIYKSFYPKQY